MPTLRERKICCEAKQYSTPNLWPTLDAMFANSETETKDYKGYWEWGDEGEAPPEIGGYCAEYRLHLVSSEGKTATFEGFFHLRDVQDAWKVEDRYLTAINREPLSQWVSMTAIPPQSLSDPQKVAAAVKHTSPSNVLNTRTAILAGKIAVYSRKAIFRMLAFIVAVAVAASAAVGRVLRGKTSSQPTPASPGRSG